MGTEHSERDFQQGMSGALIAVGCAQFLGWCMLIGVFVSFFNFMGGPAPTGETVIALLVFAIASGLVIASAAYAAFVSHHRNPYIRAAAGVVVYAMTFWVSLSFLGAIRKELLLASPFVAIGAMLSVVLPDAPAHWILVRLVAPGLAGILVIVATIVADRQYDFSFGTRALAMIAGLVLGLLAVRLIESLRV